MPYPRTWSDADKERLKTLHQEGKSIPEAAEILGRTYDSVRYKSVSLRLTLRRAGHRMPTPHQKWWCSENRLEILRQLFEEGLRTAEIGRRMRITKNAVIGKLNRMGHFNRRAPEPRRYPIDYLYGREETSNRQRCRWPFGHPDEHDFHFCCAPAVFPLPYCGEHAAVAYERTSVTPPSSQG